MCLCVTACVYLLDNIPHFGVIFPKIVFARPGFVVVVVEPMVGLSRSLSNWNGGRRVDVGGDEAWGQGRQHVARATEGL